jgi:peroxisomal 3,2-trans-enoyl-CoA isomerase
MYTKNNPRNVVSEMIRFPKLLIGAVNGIYILMKYICPKLNMTLGPSIGFGTTTLALCDVVYSTPEATFTTPFMKLGKPI